jgi:hypothetical protein
MGRQHIPHGTRYLMRHLLLLLLASLAVFGQDKEHIVRIIPDSTRANVGQLQFLDKQLSSHQLNFQAPNTVSANVTWVLPGADAAGCLQSDGSGNLSIDSSCSTGDATTLFLNAAGSPVLEAGANNSGQAFIEAYVPGTNKIWELKDDGASNGVFILGVASGTGGFDSAGATIYGLASSGTLEATGLFIAGLPSSVQSSLGPYAVTGYNGNTSAGVSWQLSNNSGNGVLLLNGTGATADFDTLGGNLAWTGYATVQQILSTNTGASLTFSNSNSNFTVTGAGNLYAADIITAGTGFSTSGNSNLSGTTHTGSVIPNNNTYILGNSSTHWNTVYTDNLNVAGSIGITNHTTCMSGQHIYDLQVAGGIVTGNPLCN